MSEFMLGQQVQFHEHLTRKRLYYWTQPDQRNRKMWERTDRSQFRKEALPPLTGIIIGERFLRNGIVEYGGYDEPTTFTAEKQFRAYLVVTGMRSAPVYVLPEDLEAVDA